MIIRDEAFTHIPSWQLSAQLDLFIALLNSTLTPDVFQTSSPSRVSLNDFCWELAPQYIHEADATHVLARNEHVGVCLTPRCHIVDMFSYSPAAFYVLAWLVFGGFDNASRDVLLKIGLFAWGTFSDRRQQQPTLTPAPLGVDGGWWRVMEGDGGGAGSPGVPRAQREMKSPLSFLDAPWGSLAAGGSPGAGGASSLSEQISFTSQGGKTHFSRLLLDPTVIGAENRLKQNPHKRISN